MKVLQINSVCGIGSTGRIVTDIDLILRENNIESYIAHGRNTSIKHDRILKIGKKLDYYVHGALTRLFDTHALLGSRRATNKFIERIKQIDPDVIHLHNLHGYYVNIEVLFAYLKSAGKPVIWTLHDCWSFTGHCAHFSYVQCDKWIDGCYQCLQKVAYPTSAFLDNSQRNYRMKKALFTSLENMTIVTPSEWLANLVEKSFLAKYPVKVIPNGIDTDVFTLTPDQYVRNSFKVEDKFMILGVASIWTSKKGLSYFIKLSEMIDDDCIIVLVGLDKKQMTKLPPKIIGINRTADTTELAQIYSTANVFINPTLEDTFPTVNLESLACGTPVITFATGGSPETIDADCGYIVEIGNIDDLRKCIDVVKSKGKDYYAKKCVGRVRDRFRKNDRLREYIKLYEAGTHK